MRESLRRLKEVFIKGLLTVSGITSTIVVLLIIVFLFREASGLFGESPVDEGYALFISEQNTVDNLSADQLKVIYEERNAQWSDYGWDNAPVQLVDIGSLTDELGEDSIINNLTRLPELLLEYTQTHPYLLAVMPAKYVPQEGVKLLVIDPVTIKSFIAGESWYPTSKPAAIFGILPIILGTLWVTLGAIIIALPIGIATSIYMAEIADPRILRFLKPTIELLAGIPSVVYGFFGLVVIVPYIQQIFNLSVGETALAGSIMLAIIALPTIITLSEDSIRSTPKSLRMASLALGASKWQTITRVIVPYGISGITSASILGVGRAIGETMAVLMVTGNAARIPNTFLQPVRTIPATIAAELGEAPLGGTHYKALFVLGCILFIITFCINLIVEYISSKNSLSKSK